MKQTKVLGKIVGNRSDQFKVIGGMFKATESAGESDMMYFGTSHDDYRNLVSSEDKEDIEDYEYTAELDMSSPYGIVYWNNEHVSADNFADEFEFIEYCMGTGNDENVADDLEIEYESFMDENNDWKYIKDNPNHEKIMKNQIEWMLALEPDGDSTNGYKLFKDGVEVTSA